MKGLRQCLWYPSRSCTPSSAVLCSRLLRAIQEFKALLQHHDCLRGCFCRGLKHTHTELLRKSQTSSFPEQCPHLLTHHNRHSTLSTSSTQLLSSASVTSTVPADKSSAAISENKEEKYQHLRAPRRLQQNGNPSCPAPKSPRRALWLSPTRAAWEPPSPC